jgi:hypothetical protein
MTAEELSSAHDASERPPRRPPRWVGALAAALLLLVAIVVLVQRHEAADRHRQAKLAALDDVDVTLDVHGGESSPRNVVLQLTATNRGSHPVVVGVPHLSAPGYTQSRQQPAGGSLSPGRSVTVPISLTLDCAVAADSDVDGLVVIDVTSAARRLHELRLVLSHVSTGENGTAADLARAACGALDVAGALTLTDERFAATRGAVAVHLTIGNDGRSPLTLTGFRLGDARLRTSVVTPLPRTITPHATSVLTFAVRVRSCSSSAQPPDGVDLELHGGNERGPGVTTFTDDALDRALRLLLSRSCPPR